MNKRFLERIDQIKSIDLLATEVCKEYGLKKLVSTKLIEIGYEDFNVILVTEENKFLMKVFSNDRTDEESLDCINRTAIAGENHIKTPKVYRNINNDLLTIIKINNSRFRVSLIEYINGKNFFDLGEKPNLKEMEKIIEIGCSLSRIDYKPEFIYDQWAITSFCNEYEKKRDLFSTDIRKIIDPIYKEFKSFEYDLLPKAYVHGDIRSTNLLKDENGNIWLIDFSVSNYTARINEIIVICDDLALIPEDKDKSRERIQYAFNYWCKNIDATELEKQSFNLLFRVANAINIMNSTYEQINGNDSEETKMHFDVGMLGLDLISLIKH